MQRNRQSAGSAEPRTLQRPLRLLREPAFQWKLLISQWACLALFSASLFGIIHFSLEIPETAAPFAALKKGKIIIYASLAALTGIELLISSILLIHSTNRLFKPIQRVKSYFVKIAMREKFPEFEISFTRTEYFQDLPSIINRALAKLHAGNGGKQPGKRNPSSSADGSPESPSDPKVA